MPDGLGDSIPTGGCRDVNLDLQANELINFPQQHRPIHTRTGEDFSIGTERYATHHRRMPGERRLMLTRHSTPDPHRFVQTPTSKSGLNAVFHAR